MRRWTLVALVVLFIGLAVAAGMQLTLGHKHVRCPGPHARLGKPADVVRCEPRPSP